MLVIRFFHITEQTNTYKYIHNWFISLICFEEMNIKQSEPFMLEILLWKKNYNLIIHETNFNFFFIFGNMLEIITNELLIDETWLSWTSSRLLQFAGIFKFQRIWKTVSCPGWCTLLVCLHVFESIKGCLVWKYFWQNLVTFPWK